jgi:1-acyl-sn-glycerol-3-phosphate acyltransferase
MKMILILRRRLSGLLYFVLLTGGALASFIVLAPFIAIHLLATQWISFVQLRHRLVIRPVACLYFHFSAAVIHYLCGTKIIIHSADSLFLDDRGVLMACNHRTRVDWMYAGWCYTACMPNNTSITSMVLKKSLKIIPIFGWCMQLMMYDDHSIPCDAMR